MIPTFGRAFLMRCPAALLILALLTLSGCATWRGAVPPPASDDLAATLAVDAAMAYATQGAREVELAQRPDWHLKGRVAFANGSDGATVQIDWTQSGEAFDIRLAAPITGRQWRLSGRPGQAELLGFDDGPRRAPDAEALLREATGWDLPVAHFPRWVRGARGAGSAVDLSVDAEGLPLGWEQAGWAVQFRDWWPGEPPLPRRVFASRDPASVRLIITEWSEGP